MNQTQLLVVIIVIALIAVAGILFFAMRKRRSQKLRERFVPECDRVVKQEGDPRKAEGYWNFTRNAERSSKSAHCRAPTDPVLRLVGTKSKGGS